MTGKRPHPAHDKEYAAYLAALDHHVRGCEIVGFGQCTCFTWAYDEFLQSLEGADYDKSG